MGGILSKTFVQGRKRRAKVRVRRSSWNKPALPVWRSKSQTAFGSWACVPPLQIGHHTRPGIGHGSTEARTEPSAANRGAGMLRLTEKPPAFSQGSTSLFVTSRWPPGARSDYTICALIEFCFDGQSRELEVLPVGVGPGFPNSSRSSGLIRGKRFPWVGSLYSLWVGRPARAYRTNSRFR